MPLPKKITHFDAYVDGRGHAGIITEVELPKLTLKTEEHRSGGMDTPVEQDLGTEKLEATLTFGQDVESLLELWGVLGSETGITLRGSRGEGPAAEPVVVEMRGILKEVDMGSWKPGEAQESKYAAALRYYRLSIAGRDRIEIDTENMVRKIGGVDQLARARKNLGR